MENLKFVELNRIASEIISEVNNSPSSIFAKNDVANILVKFSNKISESIEKVENDKCLADIEITTEKEEENINPTEQKFTIKEIKNCFNEIIGGDDYYELDKGSAEFEIKYGNEICLEYVSVDVSFDNILHNLINELINTQE